MRQAPVGHQCVECVQEGASTVSMPRGRFGGAQLSGTPVITYGLIGLNTLVFIFNLASPRLERLLTLWPPAVAEGELYRLVTSTFVHYGVIHLLFNMWALYVVGPPLERWLGRLRFGALYALSALGGSVLVYLLSALNANTAGASAAVFGLFGATFVVAKRLNLDVRWVVALIAFNLVFTLTALRDQLAGPCRRTGHRCTGRARLCVCPQGAPKPGAGRIIGGLRGAVRSADLVADDGTSYGVRVGRGRQRQSSCYVCMRHFH